MGKLYKCPYCSYTSKDKVAVNIHVYSTSDEVHGPHNSAPREYNYNMIEVIDEPTITNNMISKSIAKTKEKLLKPFKCVVCGRIIEPDNYDIQICKCGMYYRKKRGFEIGWTRGGYIKGEHKEIKFRKADK